MLSGGLARKRGAWGGANRQVGRWSAGHRRGVKNTSRGYCRDSIVESWVCMSMHARIECNVRRKGMKTMNSITVSAATIVLCVASLSPVHAQESADRIWSGGPILTMNDAAMRAEAIAERDGRIVAVGSRAEVMGLRGEGTELIDLNGRALLPGFVDAHGHMVMGGLQALSANLLRHLTAMSSISPRYSRRCATGSPPTSRWSTRCI